LEEEMDPIIPERRLDILQEKIDVWRDTEAKAIETYCSLIDVMTDVANNINGHPAESVRMLKKVREDIERMEQRLTSLPDGPSRSSDGRDGVLRTVSVVLSWIVSTGIGVIIGVAVCGGFQ
jgi:hypothetical protein